MKITKNRLKEIIADVLREESEYQKFFKKALEKAGKSIPSMSDDEKKAFFNKIEKTWKSRGAKNEVEVNEGKFKREEKTLKDLAGVVKIDFSEALEALEEDGVLEAMDHLEHAIERIQDVHKILKRKS
tara:strand:- start:244 stop:627 length:384 start_codon:yes stop_codon:yes gene_type:complete